MIKCSSVHTNYRSLVNHCECEEDMNAINKSDVVMIETHDFMCCINTSMRYCSFLYNSDA